MLDATIDGQTFGIRGTAGNDIIAVVLDQTGASVNINGSVTSLTVDPGKRMRVFLNAGDDLLTVTLISRSIPATIYGGEGDDQLDGDAGNDTINGGPGTDMLSSVAGADSFQADEKTAGEVLDFEEGVDVTV